MTAKTGKQLAETKQNGRLKPVAEAKKTRVKRNEDNAAEVAGMKTGRGAAEKSGEKRAAAKKSASQRPQPEPAANLKENPEDSVSSGIETAAKHGVEAGANDNGGDATDKATGNGDAIKSLTEAGKKRLVNKLLGLADSQATQGAFKITPADLIRLMQLHREMNPQKDRKVTVQWIEDKPE